VSSSRPRVLFVNSGILGHRAVARLLRHVTASHEAIQAEHLNLSDGLTVGDRIIRRLLGFQLAPSTGIAANLDLRRWRLELNAGWLAARRIRDCERRGEFEVLHFHPQATAYAGLARMRRTPSIVSIDATQRPAMASATSQLGRSSYQASIAHDGAVFRAARQIIATSHWAARDLAAMYPDCADKVLVMPYPVDLRLFDSRWIEIRAARTSNRDSIVHVLFVGGDFQRKGGFDLLAAWKASGLAGRAVLDLVTDWPLRMEDLPSGINLIRGVSPYTAPWLELWQRADLFVMPTRQDAFGMVYQEAAAAGVPVVATNVNAIPEIVMDQKTGLLVEPGDRDALVRAMRTLVESAELRQRMGTAARCRVARVADPDIYAATLGDLIQRLVGAHVRRSS
jgi:alpha-maltose-1-phosphate synthase